MKKAELSMMEMLKLTRHDYLNELQIILMHIDLDNASQAKQTILTITDKMRHYSMLGKLGLPFLEKWLTTFEWYHTSFRQTLRCDVIASIGHVDEAQLIFILDALFDQIEEVVNPVSEYDVHFKIDTVENDWSFQIIVKGELPIKEFKIQQNETLLVEKTISYNLWTFTISGQ